MKNVSPHVDNTSPPRKASVASHKWDNIPLDQLLILEICAGTARLSATARKQGLRALAIDKRKARSCGTEIMLLDLSIPEQLESLLTIIRTEAHRILLVFISPPCGTASRARERPIKSSLLRGRSPPRPLRSALQPDALDNLRSHDRMKVELANQLYAAVTTIILLCDSLGL